LEWMKLGISNMVCRLNVKSTAIKHAIDLQYGVHLGLHDLLKLCEFVIISQTVQDRDIVTMEE